MTKEVLVETQKRDHGEHGYMGELDTTLYCHYGDESSNEADRQAFDGK